MQPGGSKINISRPNGILIRLFSKKIMLKIGLCLYATTAAWFNFRQIIKHIKTNEQETPDSMETLLCD